MRAAVCTLLALSAWAAQAEQVPGVLLRSTPEAQGISSAAIERFVLEAEEKFDALHSFMLVRHGKVVAEGWWSPYAAAEPHQLNSLIKPFLSSAVGMAIGDGRLKLDDPVIDLFPEQTPENPSENLKAMRVRHLLTGSTGHTPEAIKSFFNPDLRGGDEFVRAFLAMAVIDQPGTSFAYNPPASLMLSAVVEKATDQRLRDYLEPRLFAPLGIQGSVWSTHPVSHAAAVRTEDLAKLGLLYLQKGRWSGTQLLSATWVESATRAHVPTASWLGANMPQGMSDWSLGYGFQFWPCRHGFYRGDGAGGQYMIVMPQHEAVLAITASLSDLQGLMDLVWERIAPAFRDAPLQEDTVSQRRLSQKLASLSLRLPPGSQASRAVRLPTRTYLFAENADGIESLVLQPQARTGDVTVAVRIAGVDQRIRSGHGIWRRGELTTVSESRPVAASGAWTTDTAYTMNVCLYQTVFCGSYRFEFSGDEVRIERPSDVLNAKGFFPAKADPPELIGKAQ